jgi:iron complex outermembrane receptor protein
MESVFLQDEFQPVADRLHLNLAMKVENNDYSGLDWLPSVRAAWTPNKWNVFWAAFSHSVRTPVRYENSARVPLGDVTSSDGSSVPAFLVGNNSLDSENLYSYETGYRVLPDADLSLDFALFFHHYDELQEVNSGPAVPAFDGSGGLNQTFIFTNNGEADLFGGEALANWAVSKRWHLQGWYSYINTPDPFTLSDPRALSIERATPANQAELRSLFDISRDWQLDGTLRYVDNMPGVPVPRYLELNLRLGWKITPCLDLSVVGTDLLHRSHIEGVDTKFSTMPSEVERGVYGKLTWRY